MNEPLLWSWDQIGNDEEILIYFAGFCAATNSDKLSETVILGLGQGQTDHPVSFFGRMRYSGHACLDVRKCAL